MKAHLLHGIIAGMLSAVAAIVFLNIYQELYFIDFSLVINTTSIFGASIIGSLLMSTGYFLLEKLEKENMKGVLNLIIMLVSFISIIPPMGMSLPLEVDFPELFPGLVIPMHFFPAMIFFGITPFFKEKHAKS